MDHKIEERLNALEKDYFNYLKYHIINNSRKHKIIGLFMKSVENEEKYHQLIMLHLYFIRSYAKTSEPDEISEIINKLNDIEFNITAEEIKSKNRKLKELDFSYLSNFRQNIEKIMMNKRKLMSNDKIDNNNGDVEIPQTY